MSLESIPRYRNPFFYIPGLFLFVILIQFFSLVRNYPSEPACGRVVQINQNLNVLVNCDSAVFMKDADNPSRLWNGDSDYVDRPLYSLAVNKTYVLLKNIGVPDMRREIKGISGDPYSYSYLIFGIFILFNLLILLTAVAIIYRMMLNNFDLDSKKLRGNFIYLFSTLFFVTANELTKTFFWTPHSQMFNILIPVLAVWMISSPKIFKKQINFTLFSACLGILMFAYPAFGLLLILLIFTEFLSLKIRIVSVVLSTMPYFIYPSVVRFLGYEYENPTIGKFREFIWVLDGITGRSPWTIYFDKVWGFLTSLPLIPSVIDVKAAPAVEP